jgi:hypothetical protein
MNLMLWILLGMGVDGLVFLAVPSNPLVFGFIYAFLCLIGSVGAFWMMYRAIRYEVRPMPIVLLAFLPFSFAWYYFERVRYGSNIARGNAVA